MQESFRVAQIAGMFDMPVTKRASRDFTFDSPPVGDDWKIGLIVGPSGSGKSTIARNLFGENLYTYGNWDHDKAVVDGFGDLPIKTITQYLIATGFSSPPSWIKPYRVLSNGEQFRCDLARALACGSSTVVFDEFTSVVDRSVAKVASAAISKRIKSGDATKRFVAVSCHYDIMEWLEPDWVLDMADGTVSRRLLRRPRIDLRVFACKRSAWPMFAGHHYLSGSLSNGVKCYMALWNETPVAFCAIISLMGFVGRRRVSRIVTLPDFQGIGIGSAFLESVADILATQDLRLNVTASHPSIISHCSNSKSWKIVNLLKTGAAKRRRGDNYKNSSGRCVVSFEYIGREAVESLNSGANYDAEKSSKKKNYRKK